MRNTSMGERFNVLFGGCGLFRDVADLEEAVS